VITYLLIFVAALTLAIGATPVARRIALNTGTVDVPNDRKLHQRSVPLLGGAAIYFAAVVALLIFDGQFYISQLFGILIGGTLVSFMGIWDDRRGLRPLLKLIGQIVAAVVLLLTGVSIEFLRDPYLNYLGTIVWVVVITNAMNLLDNMDGLSGGIAMVASAFFFMLAAFSGQFLVAGLAVAMLGACIGFLYYNFNPAKIFMGDTGSLFIGFILAALGIKLRFVNMDIVTWMIPVMVLGIPIFDTALVSVSRIRRGLNPFTTPGKDHTSHRLVATGLTQREAVLVLYLICGVLGMCAMFLTHASVIEGYVIGAGVALAAMIALVKLEQVEYPGKAQLQTPQEGHSSKPPSQDQCQKQ
jgi:UDP-GlcNAc:undecaprenyl-phosphate GlcNAc-1-phosphate transferase